MVSNRITALVINFIVSIAIIACGGARPVPNQTAQKTEITDAPQGPTQPQIDQDTLQNMKVSWEKVSTPAKYGMNFAGTWKEAVKGESPTVAALCESYERWRAARAFRYMAERHPEILDAMKLDNEQVSSAYLNAAIYHSASLVEAARHYTDENCTGMWGDSAQVSYIEKAVDILEEETLKPRDAKTTEEELRDLHRQGTKVAIQKVLPEWRKNPKSPDLTGHLLGLIENWRHKPEEIGLTQADVDAIKKAWEADGTSG